MGKVKSTVVSGDDNEPVLCFVGRTRLDSADNFVRRFLNIVELVCIAFVLGTEACCMPLVVAVLKNREYEIGAVGFA